MVEEEAAARRYCSATANRQNRLQSRRLALSIHNPALNAAEPGPLQKTPELDLRKAEPRIGIQFPRLSETVLLQMWVRPGSSALLFVGVLSPGGSRTRVAALCDHSPRPAPRSRPHAKGPEAACP